MNYYNYSIKIFALLVLLGGITSCSTNKTTATSYKQEGAHRSVSAINLKAMQTLATITPQLAKYRVVFVGEQHDQYSDHLNQLSIIKNLYKHWGKTTRIGLEMIQQPYQSFLDNYIAGNISEREMLHGVEWYERWRYDFRLYRPIFIYARTNKIPLIALNIPKELTKKITKVGIKDLNTKERQLLPTVIDRSNPDYIKRVTNVFSMHSHTSSKGIEKFLDAQLAWDEGMAFSASKYLKKNSTTRMIILAGGGHVINRSGIPSRLDQKIHSNSAVVLNNIHDIPSSKQGDYLLFSPEAKLPPTGLMGIVMTDSKNGVLVKSVSPHGSAIQAGILKGDVIIKIDGVKIQRSSDIKLWVLYKKPGDTLKLVLKRNNLILNKTFKLKSATTLNKFKKH